MNIDVRRFGKYFECVFSDSNLRYEVGTLSKAEAIELAQSLRSAADDLDGLNSTEFDGTVKHAFSQGYEAGHHATVNSAYTGPGACVDDWFSDNYPEYAI